MSCCVEVHDWKRGGKPKQARRLAAIAKPIASMLAGFWVCGDRAQAAGGAEALDRDVVFAGAEEAVAEHGILAVEQVETVGAPDGWTDDLAAADMDAT
jgi:hypothetical protein